MKYILVFFVLVSSTCFAQTQAELNKQEHNNYLKADKELNAIYNSILRLYEPDIVFISNLKKSQKLWMQFRDAELKLKYPDREPGYYGSAQQMCRSIYLTELTTQRINTLKTWVDGIEEGDVCSGSVRWKD